MADNPKRVYDFRISEIISVENNLLNKPQNITNMDEARGSNYGERGQTVCNVRPTEKGEHLTIMGACSAEG
jgi:hypothetical protein